MLVPLAQSSSSEGKAAAETAKLFAHTTVAAGYVLQAGAMAASLSERQEQVDSLLKARNRENIQGVAEDLKDVILTIHVPKEVETALEEAFENLEKPILLRLSPVGSIASPLDPSIILGLQEMKPVLDALRMMYAEMYTAKNLLMEDRDHSTAVIIQPMPKLQQAFRVLKQGQYTIIEGSYGYGAWVGYGEPDRYLFDGDEFKHNEMGDEKGVFWEEGFSEGVRRHISEADAKAVLAYVKHFPTEAPILVSRDASGSCTTLGCLTPVE